VEPLRVVATTDEARQDLAEIPTAELLEHVASRFGISQDTAGEVTIELVYRHGRFARGHKHETFTAAELQGESTP
jgi:hypothetical protein